MRFFKPLQERVCVDRGIFFKYPKLNLFKLILDVIVFLDSLKSQFFGVKSDLGLLTSFLVSRPPCTVFRPPSAKIKMKI
jgi:hypothetical protein